MSDRVLDADIGMADSSEEPGEPARFFRRGVRPQSPHEALQPETPPPPPPHRRRPRLSAASGFLSFLLIGAVGIFFALLWAEHRLYEGGPLQGDKVVFIERGAVFDILSTLETEGVIDSALFVNGALWLEGKRDAVKAGEYLFRAKASPRDVIDVLVSGKQILHSITIPEGLTSEQVLQRLRDNDVLVGDVRDTPKEGTLLPETYKVARGMLRGDLIKKMQDDQKRVLDQIWSHRSPDLPIHSPYELVTLASIVEKETGKADERPRVASVFMNRLQKRMRLQSDPTIVYGLVGGRGTLGRPITRAELDKPTPYNTYTIDGLPPGPIANPGRAALEAVANPSRTQDLFFVADGTGGHVFADSLEQHNRNVQRWRQIERDREKATPDNDKATPPVRGDQKGELDDAPVYGSLSTPIEPVPDPAPTPVVSLDVRSAAAAIDKVSPKMPELATLVVAKPLSAEIAAKPVSADVVTKPSSSQMAKAAPVSTNVFTLNLGPGLDELGITVRGIGPGRAAAALLDGPMVGDQAEPQPDTTTFAVSAMRRAELREKAAKLGLDRGSDTLPDVIESPNPAKTTQAPPQRVAHAKVIDASEGTSLDPLLDRSYDLNSPKTVPAANAIK
jgi:UPF0755 protein